MPKREKNRYAVDDSYATRYTESFKKSGHPVPLMYAFVEHVKQGTTPPPGVLKAIGTAFEIVLDGKAGLDEALGLKSKGRGAWNAVTVAKKKAAQQWIAHHMAVLTKFGDLSEEEAATRLSFALESQNFMRRYSADVLLQQYRKRWKKEFVNQDWWKEKLSDQLYAGLPIPLVRQVILAMFPRPDAFL